MNIEELREQLEQLAGSPSRPTAEARDGVRRRVNRHRRRMGATSAMAAALVVAIIGVGVWNAQDSPVKVRTVPSTANPLECRADVGTVPANQVPADVAAWADGEPVVGHGALWTIRSAVTVAPAYDKGGWFLKFPWLTRPYGLPKFTGRRLDGAGTFRAEAGPATDQRGTWVVSSLDFSALGCWEVTASYRNVGIVLDLVRTLPWARSPAPCEVGPAPGHHQVIAGTSRSPVRHRLRWARPPTATDSPSMFRSGATRSSARALSCNAECVKRTGHVNAIVAASPYHHRGRDLRDQIARRP